MSRKRYPEEFKMEAVKQVTDRRQPALGLASRLLRSQFPFLRSVPALILESQTNC